MGIEDRTSPDFQLLFETIPGLFIVLLPDDPRFTVIAVSHAYLQAVKRDREAVVGRGLFEVFTGHGNTVNAQTLETVLASFRQVLATRQPHAMPLAQRYDLGDPSQVEERHWTLVSTPVLDTSGNVAFISHQVQDVTKRVSAEKKRREIEETLRYSVELSTHVQWTANAEGGILHLSQKWSELTGQPLQEGLGEGWKQVPHPDDLEHSIAAWMHSVTTGEPCDVEHRLRMVDGTFRWMRTRAFPTRDTSGQIVRWYGTTEDIDGRTRAERRNAFLVELDDALRPLTAAQAITQTAARLLCEHLDVNRCACADVEDDENTFNLSGDYNRGVPSIVGRYTFNQFGADCLRLMRLGQPWVISDSETDERTASVRDFYRLTMIRSVICVSLRKNGKFVAGMAVHQSTSRRWLEHEVDLVQQVASRCWESIERTRITRELQEREQRYRFLAETIPQMVWTATPEGRLDYVNEQVTRYFGSDSTDVLGEGWLRWVHPDDQSPTTKLWMHSIQTGVRYEASFRLLRASDTTWRWHLVRAEPMSSADGRIVQWFGTCTDFEDQKRAGDDLRKQWHTFDTALSHTPDFTYTFSLDGCFTYVNRALLSLWRKSLDEALGKNFFELEYPHPLAERLQHQIQQVIDTIQPVRDHTPFTGPDGQTRYYEYIFVPVCGADGKVEAVAGSTRDITEREQMQQALALSQKRLRQIFSQAPVAIVVLRGPEFIVELANPYYQLLLEGRQLVGRPFADVMPDANSEVWDAFRQVMETGEPFVRDDFHVAYDQNGDGAVEDHWFNVVYNPIREANGTVSGLVCVCSDVTTQVRARQELERVNRELEEFAYVASHDLQEPLRMVNIYTELLLRRFVVDEPQAQQFAAMVHKGVLRMEALIHDLLAFSRAVVNADEPPSGNADLTAALSEAVSVLKDRIEETGASITDIDLPAVRGDTAQMAHVFQNLLSNAIKYQRPNTRPEIQITVRGEPTMWVISVSDNGIGFEPQYAERIFGLFKRLHKDEYPGTGLGLAICRRIVERYGGRIWAESNRGHGATFHISLPRLETP